MITSQNAIVASEIPNDIRIAIIVISLPNAVERRKVIAEYLTRLGLPWSFFDAIQNVKNIPPADAEIATSHDMLPGEIGCFLSHREIWKQVAAQEIDYAIILEDDAILMPAIDYYKFFTLLRQLSIDCVRLVIDRIQHAKVLVELGAPFGTLCRLTSPRFGLGCAAYALTPKAARQFFLSVNSLNNPLDLWLERYHTHKVAIYNLLPPCGVIIRSKSTIGNRPVPADESIIHYIVGRMIQLLTDCRDEWQLAMLDKALRKRADVFRPGMAFWPKAKLRKYLKRPFLYFHSIVQDKYKTTPDG